MLKKNHTQVVPAIPNRPIISAQFTFGMCAAAENCQKTLNLRFCGLRSFKVIDVDTTKKIVMHSLVTIVRACYDKHRPNVCTYLQSFSRM